MKLRIILSILLTVNQLNMAERLGGSDKEYQFMVRKATWQNALSMCQHINGTFLPDLGQGEIKEHLLHRMAEEEMVWLHAKEISIKYSGKNLTSYKYVRISYRHQQMNLDEYLCSKVGSLNKPIPFGNYTWGSVQAHCANMGGVLFNIISPTQIKFMMPHLTEGQTYWIDRFTDRSLSKTVSDSLDLKEFQTHEFRRLCIGIVKKSQNTFEYRLADCEQEFKFFCDVSKMHDKIYAPTIQRADKKTTMYVEDPLSVSLMPLGEITESLSHVNQPNTGSESNIGIIIGPVIGGGALLIIAVVVVCVVVKKQQSQERYQKRWDRYRNGRSRRVAGSVGNGGIQHAGTDGSLNEASDKDSVILGMDNGKYVHLRGSSKSSTLSSRVQGEGQNDCHGQKEEKSRNIDQPGYYLMEMKTQRTSYINKTAADEVPGCYESYSPDPVQLNKQIQNMKSKTYLKVPVKLESVLSKSTEIKKGTKKVPLVPVKKKQTKQLKDLQDYEQPINSDRPPSLPIKKFRGPMYLRKAKIKSEQLSKDVPTLPIQQEEIRVTQESEMYAQKHLGDLNQYEHSNPGHESACINSTNQCSQPSLSDLAVYESYGQNSPMDQATDPAALGELDQYENFDLPLNSSSPECKDNSSNLDPSVPGLDELDQYENFDLPLNSSSTKHKENSSNLDPIVPSLDELDQYENLATPPSSKKQVNSALVPLKDLDDYENFQLNI